MAQDTQGIDRASAPVGFIPEDEGRQVEDGVALCLSGGGYRAMVFHVGALWRLNELGMLRRIDRFSSVSGGSITAATLGLHWDELGFDDKGVAANFKEALVIPIRRLASVTVDVGAILGGLLWGGIAARVQAAYRKHLFGKKTLQDLPDEPRFVINATNVQSKVLWRFSKPYMADWRVGRVMKPRVPLAVAVGASSAFPPFLSPVRLDLRHEKFEPGTGADLQSPPFTTRAVLTDGGVYDNLGLETAWKRYRTVLVSDGGGATPAEPEPARDWARHTYRVLNVVDNQVRSLRKRQIMDGFQSGLRKGAYWSVWSDMQSMANVQPLPCTPAHCQELAGTPTRLK
ncbi:MAG: patatin-like phospholipase family protein, partial [Deltaproteobacteria bacterium]